MPNLKAIVALGRIAHDSVAAALGARAVACPFGHGAVHARRRASALYDSYHCSRYNTNTGVLTTEMFRAVFEQVSFGLEGGADAAKVVRIQTPAIPFFSRHLSAILPASGGAAFVKHRFHNAQMDAADFIESA